MCVKSPLSTAHVKILCEGRPCCRRYVHIKSKSKKRRSFFQTVPFRSFCITFCRRCGGCRWSPFCGRCGWGPLCSWCSGGALRWRRRGGPFSRWSPFCRRGGPFCWGRTFRRWGPVSRRSCVTFLLENHGLSGYIVRKSKSQALEFAEGNFYVRHCCKLLMDMMFKMLFLILLGN